MCYPNRSRSEDDASIDWKHHAYLDVVRYLHFFVALNLAFGLWGLIESDTRATSHLDGQIQVVCDRVNTFMRAFAVGCVIESGVTLFLALSIFSVAAGGWWAFSTVLSFGLFCVYFVAKSIALMISVIWIWGEDANICETAISTLYQAASRYLFGLLVVYGFQLFVGTAFLFGCGLGKAVDEGWVRCTNPPQSPLDLSDVDDDEMEENRELLGSERKSQQNRKRLKGETMESEGEAEVTSEHETTEMSGNPLMLSPADMASPVTVSYFGK